jgi:hypothetical protein
MTRYALFVWDADGDMGDGIMVGPFRDIEAAERRAERIQTVADKVTDDEIAPQVMVVDLWPGEVGATRIIDRVCRP